MEQEASMASGRTKKGNVTAEERKRSGTKEGKYPIFDSKSCVSAVRLRHHGKGVSASSVLARAASWASSHSDAACKAAVERAREEDAKRKKK